MTFSKEMYKKVDNLTKTVVLILVFSVVLVTYLGASGKTEQQPLHKVILPELKTPDVKKSTTNNTETLKNPVRIIIQECCRTDLIELQLNLFKKFLDDPFELFLVVSHSASKSEIGETLSKYSKEMGFTIKNCPEDSLSSCYDFSYKNLLPENGYAMFANSDMFLWRHFSINSYMRSAKCPISALYEVHGGIQHLHPGLHIIEPHRLPDIQKMSWEKDKSDVGGATRFWISNHDDICVHPMIWSRYTDLETIKNLRLIPMELFLLLNNEKGKLKSDLYLNGFEILHPRGGSNWQGDDSNVTNNKFKMYIDFLNSLLKNSHTTWSPSGSMAIVGREESSISVPNFLLSKTSLCYGVGNDGNNVEKNSKNLYSSNTTWLSLLFEEADRLKEQIEIKKRLLSGTVLPLPQPAPPRSNLDLSPYEQKYYKTSTIYYWKYIFNNETTRKGTFTKTCVKEPGQKYWVATWGSGEKRETLGKTKTIPSCLSKKGIDEAIFWTTTDLDPEYKKRNSYLLSQERGVGLWMWKHYVIYMMLEKMNDNDILFYLDSDMMCSDDIIGFFCLANNHDVTPFHHNNKWYTLSRLARRDAMIFMDLDFSKVANSVQYSGGNVFIKKTPYSVKFVREMAAWSQQPEVIMGWRLPSKYGTDWPEYLESNMMHQCDQAISSLMHVKYGHKSYPWRLAGFGGGSDDASNRAERVEANIPNNVELIVDMN